MFVHIGLPHHCDLCLSGLEEREREREGLFTKEKERERKKGEEGRERKKERQVGGWEDR